MKRRLLIVLLTLGTVGGYSAGFAGMRCRAHARQAAFEQHVAKVCIDAARDGKAQGAPEGARGAPEGARGAQDSVQGRRADW